MRLAPSAGTQACGTLRAQFVTAAVSIPWLNARPPLPLRNAELRRAASDQAFPTAPQS